MMGILCFVDAGQLFSAYDCCLSGEAASVFPSYCCFASLSLPVGLLIGFVVSKQQQKSSGRGKLLYHSVEQKWAMSTWEEQNFPQISDTKSSPHQQQIQGLHQV